MSQSPLFRLRQVKLDLEQTAYSLGELNQKIKLEPKRRDMKSIRVRMIAHLKELHQERSALIGRIDASPYSRIDIVDLLEKLTEVETAIATGGTESGHRKLTAFIEFLAKDEARLLEMEPTP